MKIPKNQKKRGTENMPMWKNIPFEACDEGGNEFSSYVVMHYRGST